MLVRTQRVDVDQLAEHLARAGALAHSMPPAFAGAGISEPFHGMDRFGVASEHAVGRMLDGNGLYVDLDLKSLGITKPIPHVYERTPFQRLRDVLRNDRAAISTYDGIVNARGAGNSYDILASKVSTTTVANAWSSLFRTNGVPAVAGTYTAIPTGAALDCTNVGALNLGMPNTSGSNNEYLLTFGGVSAQQINMYMVVDLLVAAGSINANTTSANTISSTALTRYTGGAGVYMTFEVTTVLGSTASNLTVSYTNTTPTSGRSTGAIAMTTSAAVQRLQPAGLGPSMQLQSGDFGVTAVASATFSAAMGASSAVALNLYKPLIFMPGIAANIYAERDSTTTVDGLVQIQTASNVCGCLAVYVLPNTTSTGVTTMAMRTCFG